VFERFDGDARQAVVLAQGEARALGHNYIGTEHVLLGIARQAEGVASRVIAEAGTARTRRRFATCSGASIRAFERSSSGLLGSCSARKRGRRTPRDPAAAWRLAGELDLERLAVNPHGSAEPLDHADGNRGAEIAQLLTEHDAR
jgi:ClpA/ClpB-like protein